MSKATFYEHFDNKEDCILALFDAAIEVILGAMRAAGERSTRRRRRRARARVGRARSSARWTQFPDQAQTLLVEIIGAGPRAMERRDRALDARRRSTSTSPTARDAERGAAPALRLAARRVRDRRRDRRARLAPAAHRAARRTSASSSR